MIKFDMFKDIVIHPKQKQGVVEEMWYLLATVVDNECDLKNNGGCWEMAKYAPVRLNMDLMWLWQPPWSYQTSRKVWRTTRIMFLNMNNNNITPGEAATTKGETVMKTRNIIINIIISNNNNNYVSSNNNIKGNYNNTHFSRNNSNNTKQPPQKTLLPAAFRRVLIACTLGLLVYITLYS